ncbi:MAG: hypothetical protein PUB93_03335, partial [Firmicutes bacterium]|nr:hypothetical protein [Bacillota bacterium]
MGIVKKEFTKNAESQKIIRMSQSIPERSRSRQKTGGCVSAGFSLLHDQIDQFIFDYNGLNHRAPQLFQE